MYNKYIYREREIEREKVTVECSKEDHFARNKCYNVNKLRTIGVI